MTNLSNKNRLIVIAGPTAVGKSRVAVELAKRLGTEVISADSMQVYRGMNVGTAKITQEEMEGIPHSLIDIADPRTEFNVTKYQKMAASEIKRIQETNRIPILCGGTGFYIQAVLYGMEFLEEEESGIREELRKKSGILGPEAIWKELKEVDPEYAAQIPAANTVKCIRALEFYYLHSIPFSEYNRSQAAHRNYPLYDFRFFVLTDERKKLFQRINDRVDQMIRGGMLKETQDLLALGVKRDSTAMQAIGYRQLSEVLNGELDATAAVEKIKTLTRRYSKRQLTWFQREKNAIWINVSSQDPFEEILKNLWDDAAER